MLRMKYKLYNGNPPHQAIVDAAAGVSQQTDLFLGQFPSGDWIYGEIDTDSANQSALETALVNWVGTFLSDVDAKAYVDSVIPANTVIQPKITAQAATIEGDRVVKPIVES